VFILSTSASFHNQLRDYADKHKPATKQVRDSLTNTLPSTPHPTAYQRHCVACAFLASFLARAQSAPSVGFLGTQDDDGQLDRPDAGRRRDIKGHNVPDQRDLESDEPRSGSMADGSCGTANALGWRNGGSYSRCVSVPPLIFFCLSYVSSRMPT
jgi:hypothetical protein